MSRALLALALSACAPGVAPTARRSAPAEAASVAAPGAPAATAEDPTRVAVDDYETDGGHTVTVWVQGNSDMLADAAVCFDGDCETTDADGLAHLRGLPDGAVALTVDPPRGVPLLLPYTLTNDRVPHLAARSLTRSIYADWLDGAWTDELGLIDLWPIDATRPGSPVVPGLVLAADAGEIWSVVDLAGATPGAVSSGTGPLWVVAPPGEVALSMTLPGGLCSARSVGWDIDTTGAPDTVEMVVPVEAGRSTSLYIHCVPAD